MPDTLGTVHVVGLGLSGLAAAVRLAEAGHRLRLHEGAGMAGGRCRSFHDRRLGTVIDNGNHLLLSGNDRALAYLDTLGARGELHRFEAAFPFLDMATGERWTVRPNAGPVPWWLFARGRRVPGIPAASYRRALGAFLAGPRATVADTVRADDPLMARFFEPMTLAVLNTTPDRGSMALLRRVLLATFARGAARSRPMIARRSLGAAFVEPALAFLAARGVAPRFNRVLKGIERTADRATALLFDGERVPLGRRDRVVLALPPHRLSRILPDVPVPADDGVIVNAHFRLPPGPWVAPDPAFLGLLNATSQWIFVRGDVASVTISAAGDLGLDGAPAEAMVPALWREVRAALGLPPDAEPLASRLLKEKRATFDQSPAGLRRRPATATPLENLALAGDAVDTGLPATIEGAIRSGEAAARRIVSANARLEWIRVVGPSLARHRPVP